MTTHAAPTLGGPTASSGSYTVTLSNVSQSYDLQERTVGGSWSTVAQGPEWAVSFAKDQDGTWEYRARACIRSCSPDGTCT